MVNVGYAVPSALCRAYDAVVGATARTVPACARWLVVAVGAAARTVPACAL
jgi:hypothetical protein